MRRWQLNYLFTVRGTTQEELNKSIYLLKNLERSYLSKNSLYLQMKTQFLEILTNVDPVILSNRGTFCCGFALFWLDLCQHHHSEYIDVRPTYTFSDSLFVLHDWQRNCHPYLYPFHNTIPKCREWCCCYCYVVYTKDYCFAQIQTLYYYIIHISHTLPTRHASSEMSWHFGHHYSITSYHANAAFRKKGHWKAYMVFLS